MLKNKRKVSILSGINQITILKNILRKIFGLRGQS